MTRQVEKIDVEFIADGVRFMDKRTQLGTIPWERIQSVSADSRESLENRFGAAGLLVLGIVALLVKQTVSYLVVEDDRGSWIFAVPGLSAMELQSRLSHLQKYISVRQTQVGFSTPQSGEVIDISDRLRSLDSLQQQGLITEEEFAQCRLEILREL